MGLSASEKTIMDTFRDNIDKFVEAHGAGHGGSSHLDEKNNLVYEELAYLRDEIERFLGAIGYGVSTWVVEVAGKRDSLVFDSADILQGGDFP